MPMEQTAQGGGSVGGTYGTGGAGGVGEGLGVRHGQSRRTGVIGTRTPRSWATSSARA